MALAVDVSDLAVRDTVWALTSFDRDGAAAEYILVPASYLPQAAHARAR
jgi:NADPH:quinone reductase-like Zn-dependent oxidoreductase